MERDKQLVRGPNWLSTYNVQHQCLYGAQGPETLRLLPVQTFCGS